MIIFNFSGYLKNTSKKCRRQTKDLMLKTNSMSKHLSPTKLQPINKKEPILDRPWVLASLPPAGATKKTMIQRKAMNNLVFHQAITNMEMREEEIHQNQKKQHSQAR